MRPHHVVAIVAVILIGIGLRVLFSAPTADANPTVGKKVISNFFQFQAGKNIPTEKFHDYSLVFVAP